MSLLITSHPGNLMKLDSFCFKEKLKRTNATNTFFCSNFLQDDDKNKLFDKYQDNPKNKLKK